MTEKIEQNLTDALIALANGWVSVDETRKAVLAYVAEQMRGLVPAQSAFGSKVWNGPWLAGMEDCRATTLANIAAYEKEQEDGK